MDKRCSTPTCYISRWRKPKRHKWTPKHLGKVCHYLSMSNGMLLTTSALPPSPLKPFYSFMCLVVGSPCEYSHYSQACLEYSLDKVEQIGTCPNFPFLYCNRVLGGGGIGIPLETTVRDKIRCHLSCETNLSEVSCLKHPIYAWSTFVTI